MGRADIATLPALSHGVRLCLHPRALVGSAYDGQASLLAHPSVNVATRRNGLRSPFGELFPQEANARASREAISLRTLLRAQSLRGHNGTVVPHLRLDQWHPGCWQTL